MNIFGINGNTGRVYTAFNNHDSSIALIKNGLLVDVIEEERLSRIKHDGVAFPRLGFNQLIADHNLKLEDVDHFDIHDERKLKYFEILAKKRLRDLEGDSPRHHLIHAYESFYTSGFDEAAVLVVDGHGTEGESITLWHVKNGQFKLLREYGRKCSLGQFYDTGVKFCGLSLGTKSGFRCGHLMSLSAYGTDTGHRFVEMEVDGSIVVHSDREVVNEFKQYYDIYPFVRNYGQLDVIHYANLAATIQANFNEIVLGLTKLLKQLLPEVDNLCITGGCAQNGVSNNVICESGLFNRVWASPMVADSGTSIGNAYYVSAKYDQANTYSVRMKSPFFGREYTNEEISDIASKMHLKCRDIVIEDIACNINQGAIYGWFQGKSEIGPRALGHRSIIAKINDRTVKDKINSKIKSRQDWRPLASIFTDRTFDQVFDVKNKDLFNFMMRTTKIRKEKVVEVQGACHVDHTALPQLITKDDNCILYNLLDTLYSKYNMLGVLNTSLNDSDEPIVENPEQAMKFLINTLDLDGIVFNGNLLVTVA